MNKSIVMALILFIAGQVSFAQDARVEKSTFGIQVGFLGTWIHNESRLGNSIALRSELGLDAAFSDGNISNGDVFVMVPAITAEPRWYYNLKRRVSKSRRIDGNSGNFFSIKITYHPDLVVGSLPDNATFISDISIIPTYGLRRNVGEHFTYEVGFGIGYVDYFIEDDVFFATESDIAANLHLRLGYRF
jgi:hypothetical protein